MEAAVITRKQDVAKLNIEQLIHLATTMGFGVEESIKGMKPLRTAKSHSQNVLLFDICMFNSSYKCSSSICFFIRWWDIINAKTKLIRTTQHSAKSTSQEGIIEF